MSKDYYKILEVEKNANSDELKKAFRKLALKYHPDKPDGDEVKFKEVNEAYQVLSDSQKRAQYDRFGSAGQNGQGFGEFDFSGFSGGNFNMGGIDLEDILSQAFGGGFGFGQRRRRGQSYQMDIEITLKEAILGVEKPISVPDFSEGPNPSKNKSVTVSIPAGVDSGNTLRLKGYGGVVPDGDRGDINLVIHVKPHPVYRKEGLHLLMELPVKLSDAVLGAKYPIDYFGETIEVKIPAGTNTSDLIKIEGKGVRREGYKNGDLIIMINVKIPKKLSRNGKKAIEMLQVEGY